MKNINIRLEAPILPAGSFISADIEGETDLDLLSKAIAKVFEEAEKSRVDLPGYRNVLDRLAFIEKAVVSGLPPYTKLDIANRNPA